MNQFSHSGAPGHASGNLSAMAVILPTKVATGEPYLNGISAAVLTSSSNNNNNLGSRSHTGLRNNGSGKHGGNAGSGVGYGSHMNGQQLS